MRCAPAVLLALALSLAASARADDAELLVLFDLDRNPDTGCTGLAAEGAVPGIEGVLRTIVDLATRRVSVVTYTLCVDPLTNGFGSETPVGGGVSPPWDAVDGDGTSGSTLIETYLPLSAVPGASVAHAYFALNSVAGSDALFNTTGTAGGVPVSIVLRSSEVSVLPPWCIGPTAVAVLCATLLAARKRLRTRGALALWLIAGAASPALVRAALGDGTLRSWSVDELVAVDPAADAPEGADILAAFAFADADQALLYIRVDALFGPAICTDWPTVDPGTSYPCNQEPPPDAGPFGNRVALTFDDGPNLATTPTIVATLRNAGVPATFFMLGNKLETQAARELALEIYEDPLFEIANHSYTHARFTTLTIEQARSEVGLTNENLLLAAGNACAYPRFFRIPYSASNCISAGVVREYGLSMVGFHIDTLDWCYAIGNGYCSPANASYLPAQYRNDMVGWTLTRLPLYGGGVAILHDSQVNTMVQLPALIAALRSAGVTFVRLDDVSVFPLINAAVNPPEPPACCAF